MVHWNPDIVYFLAVERHWEDMARGKEAQRLAAIVGTQSARDRLATALVTLARQLDPDARPAAREGVAPSRAAV
ncbi:MAG: hypothetical protein ACTHMR_10560 [Thermomicrobiales bacterium]